MQDHPEDVEYNIAKEEQIKSGDRGNRRGEVFIENAGGSQSLGTLW